MRISRESFIQNLEGKKVDLEKMSSDRGISHAAKNRMARADLNGDGYIQGTEETSKLFDQMDYYDRDGNSNTVNTSNTNVRAVHATLMRNTEDVSAPAPGNSTRPTALGELLANNPGVETNQDLINLFLRRNRNNWNAAVSDANRYGVDFNSLLRDREAPVRGASSTNTSNNTNSTNNSRPTGSLGRVAGAHRTSASFRQKVTEVAERLQMDPVHLMAVMSFETGETFSPSVRNRHSGATGLIQFMPRTARSLGTSTSALAQMSPERQLDYVERYLQPYAGRMNTVEDAYMAVLWPAAVGRGPNHVLFRRGSREYRQNSGLDLNRNGHITAREAANKVRAKMR